MLGYRRGTVRRLINGGAVRRYYRGKGVEVVMAEVIAAVGTMRENAKTAETVFLPKYEAICQAAAILDATVRACRRPINAGQVPAYRRNGKTCYRLADVLAVVRGAPLDDAFVRKWRQTPPDPSESIKQLNLTFRPTPPQNSPSERAYAKRPALPGGRLPDVAELEAEFIQEMRDLNRIFYGDPGLPRDV